MRISSIDDPELDHLNENLAIALPNLSYEIDEDLIDLVFSGTKYCTNDDISIQKIYELKCDDIKKERLIIILFTHSEAVDQVLHYGDLTLKQIRIQPIRFSKDILKKFESKSSNTIQIEHESLLNECLSCSKIITNLKEDLEKFYDADLIIKTNGFEVKRRTDNFLQSETRELSNARWSNRLNDFLSNYTQTKLNKFEFKNENLKLNETNWIKLIESCETRYSQTDSIKIIQLEHSCTILGLKELVDKEQQRIIKEAKMLNDEEAKKLSRQEYLLDTLTETQCKILINENYIEWCHSNISKDLEININLKSVHFKDIWSNIDKAKSRLWDLVNSIREYKEKIDFRLAEFLQTPYLIKFQKENNLNCLIEFKKENNEDFLFVKSVNDSIMKQLFETIDSKLKYSTYDLNENSIELVKNSKFNLFIKQKEAELKQSNEHMNYLISIYLDKKQVYCTGDKLIVNKLENEIRDFFESNTVYRKEFKENELEIFSHENIKYFKIVKHKEIDVYCDEIKKLLNIEKPFEIESCGQIQNEFDLKYETYKVKICANLYYHDRLLKFLKNLSDSKIIDYFDLNNDEYLDVFSDTKIQFTIENIEGTTRCVILTPLYLDLIQTTKEKPKTLNPTINDTNKAVIIEDYFTCYYKNSVEITVVDPKFIELNSNQLDCVMLSIDNKLQPNNSISKVVFNQAGSKLSINLKERAKTEYNNQILDGILLLCETNTNLKCKNILNCVIPTNKVDSEIDYLSALIYKVLDAVDELNFKSIGFTLYSIANFTSKEIIQVNIEGLLNQLLNLKSIRKVYLIDDKLNPLIINYLTEKSKLPNTDLSLNQTKKVENMTKPIAKSIPKSSSLSSLKLNDKIHIVYGSIIDDSLKFDAIVNSTSSDFNLNTGQISSLILKHAGNSIQTELDTKFPNKSAKSALVGVTSAGSLKNKSYIFHCNLPNYNNPNFDSEFKIIINALLDEAVKLNLKSIGIPALGAGNLKYPKDQVPKLMYESVNAYLKANNLKLKIYFVVYQNDAESVKAFKDYFNTDNNNHDSSSEYETDELSEWRIKNSMKYSNAEYEFENDYPTNKSFYSNLKQTNNECVLNFDKVKVKAYLGDITEALNEVILNPTDKSLSLDGKISANIVKKGGQKIVEELNNFKLKHDGIVWTSRGELKCKRIVHVDVRSLDTITAVFKALKETNDKNYSSITLPVIGTGAINNDPLNSIKQILDAISTYVSLMTKENRTININQIHVCIFSGQPEFLKIFLDEMSRREKNKSLETNTNFIKKIWNYVTSSGLSKYKSILNEKSPDTSLKSSSKEFKLISDNLDKIDQVKERLKEIAQNEIKTEELKNPYIKTLDDKTKLKLEQLCKKENTRIQWDKYLSRIVLIGRYANIMKCFSLITNEIAEHYKREQDKILAELTAQKIQWEYKKDEKWMPFSIYLNNEIEKCFKLNEDKLEILNDKNETFIVDLKNLTQFNQANKAISYYIRRTEMEKLNIRIRMPDSWVTSKDLDLVDLLSNSPEYIQVLDEIKKSGFPLGSNGFQKVVSIQRVQNRRLYIQYITHKEEFEKKYANSQFEKTLYHGTNEDCVQKIWKNGFNRSYAGKNATAYGKGVYFALSASYSHHYTDKRLNKPRGHMFVCKVLVGKYEQGNSSVVVPPNGGDTTVDNLTSPSIFVIYHDAQGYPEYLLTYE